jgi:hypothetical protein
VAGLADLQHSQEIVWQQTLHELGDTVEYFANVDDIGQGAQQTVEHLKIRRDIARM